MTFLGPPVESLPSSSRGEHPKTYKYSLALPQAYIRLHCVGLHNGIVPRLIACLNLTERSSGFDSKIKLIQFWAKLLEIHDFPGITS